jgi:hypothetical protein
VDDEGPDWRLFAECRVHEPDRWFQRETAEWAKTICRTRCEVRNPCLEEALRRDEWGVFGGFTRKERQRLKAGRRKRAA